MAGSGPLSALDRHPEIVTLSRSFYEGKALYGYIDGGAELYHEYGFVRLEVRSLTAENETLAVEGYEMRDPFASSGILSVSRGGCSPDTTLGPFGFTSPHQCQFSRGAQYVRVINGSGSDAARIATRRVAQIIREGMGSTASDSGSADHSTLEIQTLFGDLGGGGEQSPILVRGSLGLQNGLDEWSGLFDGLEMFDLAAIKADSAGEEVIAAGVRFARNADRDRFLERWSSRSGERDSLICPDLLLLLETRGGGALVVRWRQWLDRIRISCRDQR